MSEPTTPTIADGRVVEILMRYDRLRRVESLADAQRASGHVAIPVQYVEDVGHLLRLLRANLPLT